MPVQTKPAARPKRTAPQARPRKAKKMTTTPTLIKSKPKDLDIGGQWTEVSLIGTYLNAEGLQAFITDPAAPSIQDTKILMEQPDDDAVKELEFPIVVKVLDDARAGYRNVVVALSLSDLDANGNCKANTTCAVLKNWMNLVP